MKPLHGTKTTLLTSNCLSLKKGLPDTSHCCVHTPAVCIYPPISTAGGTVQHRTTIPHLQFTNFAALRAFYSSLDPFFFSSTLAIYIYLKYVNLTQKQMLQRYWQSHYKKVKEEAGAAFLGNIKQKQIEYFRAIHRLTWNSRIFLLFFGVFFSQFRVSVCKHSMPAEDLQGLFALAEGLYLMGCYIEKAYLSFRKIALQGHWKSGNN